MSGAQTKERMKELRDRARRILEAARQDDTVPLARVRQLEGAFNMIEGAWNVIKTHSNPSERAPFDLEAKLDEWEDEFDQRERELGIER